MSWLDAVPTCTDVFIFQAALVCEDCAAKIIEKLRKSGAEDDGDSDSYPQGPYGDGGGEADSAQFCDCGRACVNAVSVGGRKVGCPLGNPLTTDGAAAVVDSVRRSLLSPEKYGRLIGRLLRRVWRDYTDPLEIVRLPGALANKKLPESLLKLVNRHLRDYPAPDTRLDDDACVDTDSAYFVVRRERDNVVNLLRATSADGGEFEELGVAHVPLAAALDFDPTKLLAQAADEGAWD
jgi:hypothetical protein